MSRRLQAAFGVAFLVSTVAFAAPPKLSKSEQTLVSMIEAGEFRAHISFLASDALEGRKTPSKGLDVAAEYIASEFRRVGLEPLGDDGYFQTTTFKDAKVRNVAAILRGSDPKLKETFIVVSGHYDHIGVKPGDEPGDHINNGANDDASGTSTMLALAEAFARAKDRPKRSLVFVAFYGEELGMVGSRYYADHSPVPLASTVFNLNLEHMGRTDDNDGKRERTLTITGFDFTDFHTWLEEAATATGVKVEKREKYSDRFFGASDNVALARAGVPAHSVCTSFMFPDYHNVGDEWQKIDYDNMEVVTRTLAVTVSRMANASKTIEWNASYPKAERYIEAAKRLKK